MAMHSKRRLRGTTVNAEPSTSFTVHEPWMPKGACAAIPPAYDLFFPETKNQELEAKAICASCPVAWDCLDYSIRNTEIWGVWGGMMINERASLVEKYQGHTSPAAIAAHRRFLTELNRKKTAHAHRAQRLRPIR